MILHPTQELEPPANPERFKHITGYASKAAEQAARIAGVLTSLRDLHAPEVTAPVMADAITLAGFYLSEAARLAAAATVATEIDKAERLRQWLVESWRQLDVTPSEVLQFAPGPLRDRSSVKKAMTLLAEAGWLLALDPGTQVRGMARKEPAPNTRMPREGTKQATLIAVLRTSDGATI